MRNEESLEGPRELGERFWKELCDLVDQGEISVGIAKRIRDDMFEPAEPGQHPILKPWVWCAHIEELENRAEFRDIRRSTHVKRRR